MDFEMNGSKWSIKEVSNKEMNYLSGGDYDENFTHGLIIYKDYCLYLNEDAPDKKKSLRHELCHCFMYEYGHNQWSKKFDYEDVCEIVACSYDIIEAIIKKYFEEAHL